MTFLLLHISTKRLMASMTEMGRVRKLLVLYNIHRISLWAWDWELGSGFWWLPDDAVI